MARFTAKLKYVDEIPAQKRKTKDRPTTYVELVEEFVASSKPFAVLKKRKASLSSIRKALPNNVIAIVRGNDVYLENLGATTKKKKKVKKTPKM